MDNREAIEVIEKLRDTFQRTLICDGGRENDKLGEALTAAIAALDECRWRENETEPPTESGAYQVCDGWDGATGQDYWDGKDWAGESGDDFAITDWRPIRLPE